jgi:Uncharacterized conserved protein
MILVSAAIRTIPGKRDAFLALVRPVIEATRKEKGCIHYELLASIDDENQFMFFEKWTDAGSLDAHLQTPHILAYVKERSALGLVEGPSVISKYDVNS